MWQGLTGTKRTAQKLISGPSLTTKTRLLSFDWIQYKVVTHLLTGHNTLITHLYIMGLINSPLYRWCGEEEETSAHILCECDALASLKHTYFGSFFMDPGDVICLSLRAMWNFSKQGSHDLDIRLQGTKGPSKKPIALGMNRLEPILLCSVLFHSIQYTNYQVVYCDTMNYRKTFMPQTFVLYMNITSLYHHQQELWVI
jgi:hypothetical protein